MSDPIDVELTVRGRHYDRDSLPPSDDSQWGFFQKRPLTKAIRIDGPFSVETREGTLTCRDGYLAIDPHGWPYPIERTAFELMYGAVEAE